jgi:hypothetical protein
MPVSHSKLSSLVPHPETPARAVGGIRAGCILTDDGHLRITYRIQAARAQLCWMDFPEAGRREELWRHTCCEAFVAIGAEAYLELNFAPEGSWAAYAFSAYRRRSHPDPGLDAPAIQTYFAPDAVRLEAAVNVRGLVGDRSAKGLRMGLAAVIEESGGPTSYWAIRHPFPQPDFHHAGGFVLELPPVRLSSASEDPAA